MKIYTSIHKLPELQNLTKKERRQFYRKHSFKAFRHWQMWLCTVLYAAFFIGGHQLAYQITDYDRSILYYIIHICTATVGFWFLNVGYVNFSRPHIQREIKFLESKGLIKKSHNQRVDLTVKTPVDPVEVQGTAGHP